MVVIKTNLLGNRVSLFQPSQGFRVSIDTVILAAAVPAVEGDLVLDVGSGNGAAALCVGARIPGVRVQGLESQGDLVALARKSAVLSGLDDRIHFFAGDLLDPPKTIADKAFNHVLANPPYLKANSGHVPTNFAKAMATIEGEANLVDWLDFCLNMVAKTGTVTIVHRYDRLPEILDHITTDFREISIMPLIPKIGSKPKRVLVQVRECRRGAVLRTPSLILHEAGHKYTPEAEAVLRNGQPLFF